MLSWIKGSRIVSHLLIVKLILALGVLTLYPLEADGGRVRVRGYYRKDGTYVRPHYRSVPDGNPYNNYSYPGNYNPNTGQITPGDPQKYLDRYYNRSSSSSSSIDVDKWLKDLETRHQTRSSVGVRGYYRKDGTYIRPHYRSVPDGNPYNNYSYPGNYNPNTRRNTLQVSKKYQSRYSNSLATVKTNRSFHDHRAGRNTVKTINSKIAPILKDMQITTGKLGGEARQLMKNAANGTLNSFRRTSSETKRRLGKLGLSNFGWDYEFRYLTLAESFHNELAFSVSPRDNMHYRFGFGIRYAKVGFEFQYARNLTDSLQARVGFMRSSFGAGLELRLLSQQLIINIEGVELTSGYPELNTEIAIRFFQNVAFVLGSEDWFGERHWTTGMRFLFQ